MAKSVKNELVEVSKLDPLKLKEFEGLKEKQEIVVKENPFVTITDNKTYEEAKKARTTLLTASTAVEKQEGTVTKFLNQFKKKVAEKYGELSKITRDAYEKQQEEVKRYEKILEEERERKAKIEQERIDGIKNGINSIDEELSGKIKDMTFEKIDEVLEVIEKTKTERAGTFQEFDVLFDHVIESVEEKYAEQKAYLIEKKEEEEKNRIESIKNKLTEIEKDGLNFVLNLTFDNIEESKKEFKNLFENDFDFMEFSPEKEKLQKELETKLNEAATKIEKEAEEKAEQKRKDEEFEKMKRENLYMKRSQVLTEIGMEKTESGNFFYDDVEYGKVFIESDDEEEFEKTIDNIKRQIELKKTPPAPVPPVEEEKEDIVFEGNENLENNDIKFVEEEIAKEIEVKENHICLGEFETVGELKKILEAYDNETLINFRNQPKQQLFEGNFDGTTILYFQ